MGEREGVVIELLPCIDLEILLHFLFFDNFEEKKYFSEVMQNY